MVNGPAYSETFERALRLAARLHQDQTRKGNDLPYITHPVQVAMILLHYGFPVEVAVAGLLHDVVEDQEYSVEAIAAEFGRQVAELVAALSENKKDHTGSKRPWEVRKEECLEQVRLSHPYAAAIKAADTLHNARATVIDARRLGPQVWQRFTRGPAQLLAYYQRIAEMAREKLPQSGLVDELEEAVAEMAQVVDESASPTWNAPASSNAPG
jgi:(p)ppGpp synthase/HD superfamily hydrolase